MSLSNMGTGGQPPEPFRMFAEKYLDAGLSVFPCGRDDGKKPLVKWGRLQSKLISSKGLDSWLRKHSMANIGIVTGQLSNLTIVDSDDPSMNVNALFQIYGETPLVVQTPSGGYHLYYSHNGERSSQNPDMKIDIRGQGGFVVAPPSFNPVTGEIYHFCMGDIWDFDNLPAIENNKSLHKNDDVRNSIKTKGERNNSLFHHLKASAPDCSNFEALACAANAYNQSNLFPSLDDSEVMRIVASIWSYKEAGKLFQQGRHTLLLPVDKIERIKFQYPRAMAMYIDLLSCHGHSDKPFSIGLKGYAKRSRWSDKTVAQARDILLQNGVIQCLYNGGRYKGDSSKYCFL